jgi:hypothetical protein
MAAAIPFGWVAVGKVYGQNRAAGVLPELRPPRRPACSSAVGQQVVTSHTVYR